MKQIQKHYNIISIAILLIICILIYFINMDNYPFIDTDETKFVSIAKEMLNYSDWINVKLNGENLFSCPPLFFWITNFVCLIFGKISAVTARFPIAVVTTVGIISLYSVIKNILTKTYAIIIALIYALSFGTIIFARLATNDMLSAILIMITSLLSYKLIFIKSSKNKTILWLAIFFFSALSTLASGLFGAIIPAIAIASMLAFSGRTKELITLKGIFWGIIIFLVIVMPWHIIMICKHGGVYIKEFIDTYNIFNTYGIKKMPSVIWLFFIGFLPWSFSLIWILATRIKDICNSVISYFQDNSEDKLRKKWNKLKKHEKFISINTILFFTGFIFAIIWGSKYTFLVLFLIFPSSCISGYYWFEYVIKKKHDKSIFISTIVPNLIFITCSLMALFGHNILNKWIFGGLNHLLIPLIIFFFIIPVIGIFAVILKWRTVSFLSNIILMFCITFIITPSIFNFIVLNGGENDLINFASKANKDKVVLSAFIPSKKYSLLYYYDNYIKYFDSDNLDKLKEYLVKNPNDYVVVEIKDLWDIEDKKIKYMLLDAGKRYCLIQHMSYEYEEKEEEPKIIIY